MFSLNFTTDFASKRIGYDDVIGYTADMTSRTRDVWLRTIPKSCAR